MRCGHCGYQNPDYRESCLLCNELLGRERIESSRGRRRELTAEQRERRGVPIHDPHPTGSHLPVDQPVPQASILRNTPDLDGTVIHVDPHLIYEHEDFNGVRFANRLLIFLIVVSLPFVILRILLAALGPLSAVLCLLGVLFLSRFLFPTNILAYIGIFSLLNPFGRRNRERDVPVRVLRVRDSSETEYLVRIKGNVTHGGVMEGDEVFLWGQWRRGTLCFKRGVNLRTGSDIILQKDYAWVGLIATLSIMGMIVLFFYSPIQTVMETISKLGR
jgi:hypothetical protein